MSNNTTGVGAAHPSLSELTLSETMHDDSPHLWSTFKPLGPRSTATTIMPTPHRIPGQETLSRNREGRAARREYYVYCRASGPLGATEATLLRGSINYR